MVGPGDTRAWRLEEHRHDHPQVDALLRWRKAERVATTDSYAWLDQHVGADGRLREELVERRRCRRANDRLGPAEPPWTAALDLRRIPDPRA